jgi:hypothetical protein
MLYLIYIKLKIMIHAKKSLKIFFISVLLVLLSCSESENLQKNAHVSNQVVNKSDFKHTARRTYSKIISDFEKDKRIYQLDSILKVMEPYDINKDRKLLDEHYIALHNVSHDLYLDYGQIEMMEYARKLSNTSPKGACCKLTDKGTVDWSCCGFWGRILAAIGSIGCPEPTSLDKETRDKQAESYYLCVQESVCKSC